MTQYCLVSDGSPRDRTHALWSSFQGVAFDKAGTVKFGPRQSITSYGAAGTLAPVRVVPLQVGEPSLKPVALCLNGLKIHLGPELRAMFPVVLNMGISGDIELNGAADPDSLRVAGTIHLDGGEVRCPH